MKIALDADTTQCARLIENLIDEAINNYCQLRGSRLEWLSRFDEIVEEFKIIH